MFFHVSEKYSGSGLGLYIINEIIKKLDGSISLESEEGKFSKFMVDLPNVP